MKATTIHPVYRTHPLIKTRTVLLVTILFFTGGTAYAGNRHHDFNTGTSIIFDYFYSPGTRLYHEAYRQPRHHRHYNNHYYRNYYGHYRPWKNQHAYKHRRNHYNAHRDD